MEFLNSTLDGMSEDDDWEPASLRRSYVRAEPFNYFSDFEFKLRFRVDKENVLRLLEALQPDLEFTSNRFV